MGKRSKLWRTLAAVFGCLLAPVIAVSAWASTYPSIVSSAIGGTTSKVVKSEANENVDTEYYKTNGQTLEEWIESEKELIRRVQGEGSILVKNNGILPLDKGTKISAFGYGTISSVSTGLVRFGTPGTYTSFKDGMEESGKFVINPSLYEFYQKNATAKLSLSSINEPDITLLDETDRADYGEYDTAVVVISRSGGEGSDLDPDEFLGNSKNGSIDGYKYLSLQEREKALLREVTQNFDKVIAVYNGSPAMELDWVEEYGIDACLIVGAIGATGWNAISDILTGVINPSGRTVDTYAADSLSAPAMANFGDYTFANADEITAQIGTGDKATKYLVENEGIYVGYKYYETRYEDAVLGQGDASSAAGAFKGDAWKYEKEVTYPFGYGLSYSDFEYSDLNVREKPDAFEVSVNVTNKGTYAGKEVVQIYAQTPYTDFDKQNGIEAASVQLAGFTKTSEIAPGKSEVVTVVVEKEDLAHYDPYVNKTFILEDGQYYLTAAKDAHDAVNNILAQKAKEGQTVNGNLITDAFGNKVTGNSKLVWDGFKPSSTDAQTYAVSAENVIITNRFDDADLNYWKKDSVTYLSRKNWSSTWPKEFDALEATADMITAMNTDAGYVAGSSDMSGITSGSGTEYSVAMMIGRPFDDENWQLLLDQMSVADLVELSARSGLKMVASINYPDVFMKDGSHRVTDRYYVGHEGLYALIFPSAVIQAATYNTELMLEIGRAYGEDNIRTATAGHYAPSVNIHRTPYSGRNFEYYSEDGFLSGKMSVGAIVGMQEKGAIPYLKHFAFNDQETNRSGVATFLNQQAAREIYLEAFKAGVVEGKTKGLMGGFNRVGCTWTGAHYGLMTNVLREEWGSTAIMDTDAGAPSEYMNFAAGLAGGTTMWATSGTVSDETLKVALNDSKVVKNLRKACHYLLYNVVNSLAFNGIAAGDKIIRVYAWWEITALIIEIVLGLAFIGSAAMAIVCECKKKKEI